MTTCALPGCNEEARPGSITCCVKHQKRLYKETHRERINAVRRASEARKNPLITTTVFCECGCGKSFDISNRIYGKSQRRFYSKTCAERARYADETERAKKREASRLYQASKPKPVKIAKPKPPRAIACKVEKPAPAQTHTRLKPKSHNATALDERMDKVVRDAWQNGDKYQRAQIEALNEGMVFA